MEANNMAAMREALADIRYWAKRMDEKGCSMREFVDFVRQRTESALSAPARNCDVGTMEEQAERFIEFCAGHLCDNCPNSRAKRCGVGWSQMPFAPAEGGAE